MVPHPPDQNHLHRSRKPLNPYIESFHSRFRDECLLREVLLNLHEARVVIEDWRCQYNTERPHSRLGYLSPEAFLNRRVA
ncbi:MAG: transposase [Candidatus Latescibacteria bacterium]|nr:transposase [Candidatus Latescibacterota bacterium]